VSIQNTTKEVEEEEEEEPPAGAMSALKPTLIIIHGAWHIPESYEKLVVSLEKAGYEVHCPRLPSTNQTRPPNADLYTDSDLIRNYVSSLIRAGRTVVAILHSYGGQVGSNALVGLGRESRAAQGLPGGVSHLVYLAGFAVSEGTGMMDKVKEFGHMDLVPVAFNFAEDDTCVHNDPKTLLIGTSSVADEEVDRYLATLVRWNGKGMYLPLKHAAWREIPVAYIYLTVDMTVPLEYQKSFVEGMEKAGRPVQTFELATGHCANLTATEEVVDVINKIVEA
jgi:pimeloyl-ACP methyl ester carboxylesterase